MMHLIKKRNIVVLILSILLLQHKAYSTKNHEIANIFLNFEKSNLSNVVDYISELKNINIIPNKNLDNIPVSLSTREPLTLEKAWDILLTLLEINSYTIINVDNLYRIVSKQGNKQEPLPTYSNIPFNELPDNDTLIRYVYFLENIKASMISPILQTMLEGTVQTNEDLDALIITDRSIFIKSVMKIVEELDQGGLRESIKIIKLKYAIAEDIAKLFQSINPTEQQKNIRFLTPKKGQQNSTFFSSKTKIIPETRQNSLILLGVEQNIDKVIKFIYKYIDIPVEAAGSRLHIKELKYIKAEKLRPVLIEIIKKPTNIPKASQYGEYKFFEDVIIATDSSQEDNSGGGNKLIISCNKNDWKRIDKFIDKIDKPQPQVSFEVMVVDVGLKSNFDLFAQFKPKKEGMFGKHTNPYFQTALPSYKTIDLKYAAAQDNGIRTGTAGANLTFGIPGSLWGMIKATLSKENFNIITQPYMTVNNNQECKIHSSEQRRVPGKFKDSGKYNEAIRETYEANAKSEVTLTPKVNLNGTIDLNIQIDIAEFKSNDQTIPDTSTRTLSTRINIGTGEVIVLGGLTKSKYGEDLYKVPILGSIPIIGNLFKSRSKEINKTNLYIFIRPSIIKPRSEDTPDEYTQMKLNYAKYNILKFDTYLKDKDPIQRWYFKPSKQTVKQKTEDAKKGIFRPIDNYATGMRQPKSVDIKNDKYFTVKPTKIPKKNILVKSKKVRHKKSRLKKTS